MADVVALGELLIDFACLSSNESGYPVMAAHPGGALANFLATLNQYGAQTAFLGKVGNDAFGKMLVRTLKEAGIETRGIVLDDAVFTTLAFVTFDETGNRSFSFARKPGADTELQYDELDLSLIDDCKVFHFGTLSLTDSPARETTRKAVAYAKEKGKMITFDPNLRLPLWKDPEDAKKQMEWGLSQADIVKISDEEVEFLWGADAEEGASKVLSDYGVKLVFVTCGAEGCVYQNRLAKGKLPSLKGVQVADTTGAGDIFGGSAVSRILQKGKRPEEFTGEELTEIVRFATTAAGLSTEKPGGISSIPSFHTVMDRISRQS